jgi:diguanylate cyclase (GGDEF)-like protein
VVYCEICPFGEGDSALGCDPSREQVQALDRVVADDVQMCTLSRLREERYDSLTGLVTMDVLLAQTDRFIRRRFTSTNDEGGESPTPALLPALIGFADGDRVKDANDAHGHDVGDRGIVSIGSAIAGTLRIGEAFVARRTKGSDEFIFVVFDVDLEAAREITLRLRGELGNIEVLVNDIAVSVGATIAVKYVEHVASGEDVRGAIQETDMAVNALKHAARKKQLEF